MKTTKEKIEIMKHFVNGGEVESAKNGFDIWKKAEYPAWDWLHYDYRKKEEPEYVPFDISDAAYLIGKTLDSGFTIYSVSKYSVLSSSGGSIHFGYLLSKYKFEDGSPCGKLKTNK